MITETELKKTTEYEIYIGCNDSQLRGEVVSQEELTELVIAFFARNHIDFSLVRTLGGYLHEDGEFIMEDSLWINIVGNSDMDIIGLAKSLSMYMNQENSLVIKNTVKSKFC